MEDKKHYYLMISCPGDVIDERAALEKVISELNEDNTNNIWIETMFWTSDTFSDASVPAQESINTQMLDKADAMVAIFNARFGTKTKNYSCGTEEELEEMIKRGKQVFLWINTKPQANTNSPDFIIQLTQRQEYINKCKDKKYYREFKNLDEFNKLAKNNLKLWINTLKYTSISNNKINTSIIIDNKNKKDDTKKELGWVDCIEIINESVPILTEEQSLLTEKTQKLSIIVNEFKNRIIQLKKFNRNKDIIVESKKFANNINDFKNFLIERTEIFPKHWNDVYSAMESIIDNPIVNNEEKVLLIEGFKKPIDAFINLYNQMEENAKTIQNLAGFQKDITITSKELSVATKNYALMIKEIIENGEKLINSISIRHNLGTKTA